MKLYDVPNYTKVKVIAGDAPPAHRDFQSGEILTFCHIDGMYSYCVDAEGNAVHLKAWADVEIVR